MAKYRQPGYQDSDRRDRDKPPGKQPRPELTREERIQRRSLRHAIDREANEVVRCHNCGRGLQQVEAVLSGTACPHCSAPQHCCRACTHFNSTSRWQCSADIPEAVGDKNRANDCAMFQARMVLDVTGRRSASKSKSNDPKSAFEDLFKR